MASAGLLALSGAAHAQAIGDPTTTGEALPRDDADDGFSADEQSVQQQTQAAPVSSGYGDIIVTAQKRDQSINDVGQTITVASGEALAARGITDVEGLTAVVPGLVYTPSPYNTPVYTLRGVGYYDNALAGSPTVSVYVDEVPIPFPVMTQGASLDVERVEVLKGPQGTLYGQNSTGGAINYIAAKPTDTFEAGIDLGYGRFDTFNFSGFVSGPITDTLRMRVAGRLKNGQEWQRSYTRNDELGETMQTAGRVLLDWTPTDRLSFTLNVNAWHDESDSLANQLTLADPINPGLSQVGPGYPLSPSTPRAADWTPGKSYAADNTYREVSLRANYELNDTVTLTSITSYQDYDHFLPSDLDATPFEIVDNVQRGNIKSFNQELRASFDLDNATILIGGNYMDADVEDFIDLDYPDSSVNQPIPGIPRAQGVTAEAFQKIENFGVFANADVQVNDAINLVAGIRYTKDIRDYNGCTTTQDPNLLAAFEVIQAVGKAGTAPVVPVGLGECYILDANFNPGRVVETLSEDNISFRLNANYKFDQGTLLYASLSRGFKSGGFPTILTASQQQLQGITQDRVTAYELGIKAPLFNDALQFNAAGFYYDYKNKQVGGRLADPFFGLLQALVTVPKSRVAGAEVELQFRPFEGFQASVAGTYVDTKIQEYTGFALTNDNFRSFEGGEYPTTPKYQLVGDAEYRFDLNPTLAAFVGGGVKYNSETHADFLDYDLARLKPYTLVDVRAGLSDPDERWTISFYGRNIFNTYYWNSVFRSTDTAFRQPGRPVTYGANLSFRFD